MIPVIDLFAGLGGLGEGFSSLRDTSGNPIFQTIMSIEEDELAHKTLRLRSFFRMIVRVNNDTLKALETIGSELASLGLGAKTFDLLTAINQLPLKSMIPVTTYDVLPLTKKLDDNEALYGFT